MDSINYMHIKNLPKEAIIQLYYILNACLKNQYFPKVWKHAKIIFFRKLGKDPKFAANYRPIIIDRQADKKNNSK